MIPKLIVLLACASGVSFANNINSFSEPGDDLEALCANKLIHLTQISQLYLLADKLDGGRGGCSERNAAAVKALRDLIRASEDDECSMESHNRFRGYYKEYLDTSTKELKNKNDQLPSALRRFALAYGLEVSGLCRANMVSILTNEAHKETKPEHLHAIESVISPTGPLAQLLHHGGSRQYLLLLPSEYLSKKISLELEEFPLIKSVKILCERRFKPIYQPVMLPVARMASLGFELRGPELERALNAAYANDETIDDVDQWASILLVCEGLNELELTKKEEDKKQSEDNDATMVNGNNRNEALEVKKRSGGKDKLIRFKVEDDEILEFKPNLNVDVPDKLVRPFDRKQAISLFGQSTSRNENTNAGELFFSKRFERLIDDLVRCRQHSFFAFMFGNVGEAYRVLKRAKDHKLAEKYGHTSQDIIADELVTEFNLWIHELKPILAVGGDSEFNAAGNADTNVKHAGRLSYALDGSGNIFLADRADDTQDVDDAMSTLVTLVVLSKIITITAAVVNANEASIIN